MKKSALKPISDKRQEQNEVYFTLVNELRLMCDNRSELSGKSPNWESNFQVEPHHFEGRIGDNFINPFGIIMLTREEHDIEHGRRKGKKQGREKLRGLVFWTRLKQGFEYGNSY